MAEKAQIMCVAQIIAAPATAALSSSLLSTQLSLGLVLTKAKKKIPSKLEVAPYALKMLSGVEWIPLRLLRLLLLVVELCIK